MATGPKPPESCTWRHSGTRRSPDRVHPIGARKELLHEGYDMNPLSIIPAPRPASENVMPTVLKNARGMWLVLERASELGLPLPFAVRADHIDERVDLQFSDRAQMLPWAGLLEVELTADGTWLEAHGEWCDVPLRIVGRNR